MPGSGNNGTIHALVTACSVGSGDVYQRHVSGLYRQALLTLGDSALADVPHRLAESVFRRCQQSLSPCQAARGEWDAYAGVGPVGQCGR